MEFVQYAVAVVAGVGGLWIFILNWHVFIGRHVQRVHTPSWIPLISGALLCVALLVWPNSPYRWYCWVPFLLDWGSIPGITFSIWHGIRRSRVSKK